MTTDTTTPASTVDALVEDYFAMWLETDDQARAERIAAVFTEDGRHVDPHADARGHAGLAEMMAGVHAQFPGLGMERVTAVDAHNDQLRFGWELRSPDGSVLVAGVDVAEVAPDGRFLRVTGFWGPLA